MPRSSCKKCHTELAEREGVGRPPSYCSTGCRRAAEHEIRRAQKAIETIEVVAREHRENMAVQPRYGLHCCGQGDEAKQRHLDWLEGERELLESRMRELLDDAGDAS